MPTKKLLTTSKISEVFEIFKKGNPDPKSELYYTNDFTFLVAIILSAQSTDKGVNKATPALFKKANSPHEILALGEEGLKKYIKTIGLFNTKAKNIISLCKVLVEEYGGMVPHDKQKLEKLSGIGSKSASVFLNEMDGLPYIAVDTHVFRLSNLIGIVNTKTSKETEKELYDRIPKQYHIHTSDWLVLHGRYTCIARRPKCEKCPISHICLSAFANMGPRSSPPNK